jgi:hypothetical protein
VSHMNEAAILSRPTFDHQEGNTGLDDHRLVVLFWRAGCGLAGAARPGAEMFGWGRDFDRIHLIAGWWMIPTIPQASIKSQYERRKSRKIW